MEGTTILIWIVWVTSLTINMLIDSHNIYKLEKKVKKLEQLNKQ